MSNVIYSFENKTGYGKLPNGIEFLFDSEDFDKIKKTKWYISYEGNRQYLIDSRGRKIYHYLLDCPKGYEIDHINMDTLDNRSCNLRICTHQQNQCNQSLQKNNTSGCTGVSYYSPRRKYRARIKTAQRDINLGYYYTLIEAIQARNAGMEYMFGEFGRYNDVPEAPPEIKKYVYGQCVRFADLSVCKAFLNCMDSESNNATV